MGLVALGARPPPVSALATASDGELPLADDLAQALANQCDVSGASSSSALETPAEDLTMRIRYTSGTNREGRRRAQLRACGLWIQMVRTALSQVEGGWRALPGDRSEYDILEGHGPLES